MGQNSGFSFNAILIWRSLKSIQTPTVKQPNISTVLEVDTVTTLLQVDWNKVSGDSASVADKIKKKLHIQSKSGWEKFQVLRIIMICSVLLWILRNGPPRTSTWLEDSLADSSSA